MPHIEGVSPSQPIATNERGGMQSATPYGFHLLPPESMFAAARVMAEGAKRYARDNWRKIDTDEHINHAVAHLYAHMAGDTQDDHLAHAICRTLMAFAVAQSEQVQTVKVVALDEVAAGVRETGFGGTA